MSGLYSQGWEDGDQMVALPIALTAPSLSMETVVSGPSTYIHTDRALTEMSAILTGIRRDQVKKDQIAGIVNKAADNIVTKHFDQL